KLGRHAGIGGILEHSAPLAVLDLPADLAAELKVQAAIVDRPRAVAFHVNTVGDVVEKIFERNRSGKQNEIAHADNRNVLPPLSADAGVTFAPDRTSGVVTHFVSDQHAVANDVRSY